MKKVDEQIWERHIRHCIYCLNCLDHPNRGIECFKGHKMIKGKCDLSNKTKEGANK